MKQHGEHELHTYTQPYTENRYKNNEQRNWILCQTVSSFQCPQNMMPSLGHFVRQDNWFAEDAKTESKLKKKEEKRSFWQEEITESE